MNDKNIFVDTWSGESVGLDRDFNAANLGRATGDLTRGKASNRYLGSTEPSLPGHAYKDFVTFSLEGSAGQKSVPTKAGGTVVKMFGMRGSGMATGSFRKAADPTAVGVVFDEFRQRQIDRANAAGGTNTAFLNGLDWGTAKLQFLAGVKAGLGRAGQADAGAHGARRSAHRPVR